MFPAYVYKPVQFYLIAYLGTWIPFLAALYLSYKKRTEWLQLFIIPVLFVPLIATLIMIYASGSQGLIHDFWHRVFLVKITPISLLFILLVLPCTLFFATELSLLFGRSKDQFALASELNVMKGGRLLSIVVPFVLAPILEELGWRGYGVDSLKANFNLFTTSMLFALLWGIWHLPAFFIKGYYHHSLWNQGLVYVLNFFVSMLPIAFLTNWVYYSNDRSIPAAILFHSMLNIFSIIFRTEQFTKCIITLLLCVVSAIVVLMNKSLFF